MALPGEQAKLKTNRLPKRICKFKRPNASITTMTTSTHAIVHYTIVMHVKRIYKARNEALALIRTQMPGTKFGLAKHSTRGRSPGPPTIGALIKPSGPRATRGLVPMTCTKSRLTKTSKYLTTPSNRGLRHLRHQVMTI